MNYNEIKKFEIEQIIISIKRMLSMGFSIEEITRDIEEDTKKMLANLTAEQLQTNESMKKHRNIKKEENGEGGNVRFRYWNSALLEFIMFDDGVYSYTKSSGFNMAEPEAEFDWQNAEQQITINPLMYYQNMDRHEEEFKDVEFFEGDIIKMHFFYDDADPVSLGWVEGEKEVVGILKCENLGGAVILSENKEYSYSLLQDPLEELERLGNIHENKELMRG